MPNSTQGNEHNKQKNEKNTKHAIIRTHTHAKKGRTIGKGTNTTQYKTKRRNKSIIRTQMAEQEHKKRTQDNKQNNNKPKPDNKSKTHQTQTAITRTHTQRNGKSKPHQAVIAITQAHTKMLTNKNGHEQNHP